MFYLQKHQLSLSKNKIVPLYLITLCVANLYICYRVKHNQGMNHVTGDTVGNKSVVQWCAIAIEYLKEHLFPSTCRYFPLNTIRRRPNLT